MRFNCSFHNSKRRFEQRGIFDGHLHTEIDNPAIGRPAYNVIYIEVLPDNGCVALLMGVALGHQ